RPGPFLKPETLVELCDAVEPLHMRCHVIHNRAAGADRNLAWSQWSPVSGSEVVFVFHAVGLSDDGLELDGDLIAGAADRRWRRQAKQREGLGITQGRRAVVGDP